MKTRSVHRCRGWRGPVWFLAVLGLTGLLPWAGVTHAAIPAGGTSAAQLDEAFRIYGDTSGRWSGGDSTASVPLPDGRVVWLFSDTFVGSINPDGTRPRSTPMVHNSIVLQDGTQMVDTLTGGAESFPTSLAGGERDAEPDNAGFWVADGTVEGSTLRVLYNHYRRAGTGSLDVEMTGTWLATFDLPALTLRSLTDLQLGSRVAWGSAILEDGAYTYVYGTEFAGAMRFAHVARVPAGGLGGPWQFWTGSDWSALESESARLLSGTGTAYGVQRIGTEYVLVTVDSHIVFSPTIVAYTAAAPTGPFTGPLILHTAPEAQPSGSIIVYDSRIHAALARPGKLLLSYNVNSLRADDTYADARLYRPRFVEVDWPRPVPDPATLPKAPTGLVAMVDADGIVHVSWNAVEGALRYWVYLRDLTGGATHFGRVPGGTTLTSAALALTSGHTYELSVSAENAAGAGERSTVVAVTPTIPPPPAPTGVTAAANTTGNVTVSWSPVPRAWRYQVFRRDVTAGQTTFEGFSKVGSDTTRQELAWMTNGHEYEFYVVAEHGGGASPPSAMVRATVRNDPPAAPTGLTATGNADGTITLRWTAPAPSLWYWVYQRDISAGDTADTRLPLPITAGTEMTAGFLMHEHLYEFAVAGISGGGEGPKSAPARATARYPLPPAPTNLRATPGDGQVLLAWDAPAPDLWYWVYQRDVTAGETTLGRLPLPISQGTTMGAGYLTNGHTYEFAVSALGPGGSEGPKSVPVQAVPNPPLPVKPMSLVATPNADGTITLSWTIATAGVWHWIEMRDVTAGQSWGRLPYPLSSGTTFTAGLLQHEHAYEFRVVAYNIAGEGPKSEVVVATCRYARPGAPTGLRGNTGGDGTIELNWNPPGAGGFYYWIYFRDVTAGEAFVKGIYPTDKPSAGLGFLRHQHVYEFKVTAENLGGEGPPSATIQVTALGGLPGTPTNLSATAGDGQAVLRWTASPTANVWYWIEYRAEGGPWQRLQYPLTTCCTFTVTLLANGTTYDFRVRATNASGDGAPSNVATVKPMPPLPQPPTGLTATPGDGKVTLRWTASATSNVWYWIEYRPSGGAWQRLPYPLTTCCTFTVTYLTNGTTYDFRVRSNNLAGDSAPSNAAAARPWPPVPQPPTGLVATAGDARVTLRWNASPTPGVWYWIVYTNETTLAVTQLPYPVSTCCTFTVTYLPNGQYMHFRVVAFNAAGVAASEQSNTVRPMPPFPQPPTGFTAAAHVTIGDPFHGDYVETHWRVSTTGNVYHRVYARNVTRGETTWGVSAPVTGTEMIFENLALAGDVYDFKVSAWNLAGEAFSGVVRVQTKRPKYYAALEFERATLTSFNNWNSARQNQGAWADYDFIWSTDYCSFPRWAAEFQSAYEPYWALACWRHDFGYRNHKQMGTFGGAKGMIDDVFLWDMRRICDERPNIIQVIECQRDASWYYAAVKNFGN